jgi:hypothetical protein
MHLPRTRPLNRTLPALAAAALLAPALMAGCARTAAAGVQTAATSATAAGAPVPASAIARLTAIARHAATLNDDRHPAWITAVLTTHARALTSATPGDTVPGSARTRVYLITMRGHFTDRLASGPPGSSAPTGRYLSLVVDARTFTGLDFGLSAGPPPVPPSSLGPVTYLSGQAATR